MEIKRICRFLIVIFLILSLLFNYLYTVELKKRTVVSDELVESAVRNLSSYGIDVNEANIEKNMPERDIYFFEISDNYEYYKKVSSSLCNCLFVSNVVTTEFDTPDGYSVGIYDMTSYGKELGRIIFSRSDLSFVFSKNGLSMKDGDEPIENMQTDEISESIKSVIYDVVVNMTNSSRLGYRIAGSSSNDMYRIVSVMQTIDNNDISNSFMNFVFSEGELVILSGKWITEVPKAKYHNTLLDGVNVLYKLNLDQIKSIDRQEIVYSLRITDNKCYIIPCWKISYTNKQNDSVISLFDAL